MKILVDTNILIPAEPASTKDLEAQSPLAIALIRIVAEGQHTIVVHPATYTDLSRDKDTPRGDLRKQLLGKYSQLSNPPEQLGGEPYGSPDKGTNDWVDNQLLFALERHAVDILVTDDQKIHKKAERLGLSESVYFLAEAVDSLKAFVEKWPTTPPAVTEIDGYNLNEADPIWQSLREDYKPKFDTWLREKVKKQGRKAYVISLGDAYAGICILKKKEDEKECGFGPNTVKVCTFKVSDEFRGNLFGELLLKATFNYAKENGAETLFVTIFPKQEALIALFEKYGFEKTAITGELGDDFYVKRLRFTELDRQNTDSFEFHRKFGPWVTKFGGNTSFLVPIQDSYHQMLFPDHPRTQLPLFAGRQSFSNAIGKVYLCGANITKIRKGDNLFFYRSDGICRVTALGIVESTLRTSDPEEMVRYVLKRTVYERAEIENYCRENGPALAIRFRQVHLFANPIELDALKTNGVLNGPPQSIQEIPSQGVQWLSQQMK
jgi:L-amino acid N-acyltransferase YncA